MGIDELSDVDRMVVLRAIKLQRFLTQPFNIAEHFIGKPSKYVKLEDTVKDFKRILDGEFDDRTESDFYKISSIDKMLVAA